MATSHIFKVMFVNQGKVYEVYARKVSHGSLFGFIEVEELVFGERSSVVVDPAEERIKNEFQGVKRSYLPMHSVLRIDEVRKQGVSKISALEGGNVSPVPDADVHTAGRRFGQELDSMLELRGGAALSDFRLAKLLGRLRAIWPALRSLESRQVFFVDASGALAASALRQLAELLQATTPPGDNRVDPPTVLVLPRFGTISPWSSKATDIARVCGLKAVRRIEAGIEYRLASDPAPDAAALAALAALLHDRMTETVLLDRAGTATAVCPRPGAAPAAPGDRA